MGILHIVMSAAVIAVVFGLLILVHEIGHFIAARRIGVRVEKFALGWGKKLFGIKRGDTEYVLNLIPIGGYVKLAGEDPGERNGAPDELMSKSAGKRFWVFASGSAFNYIFGFLVFVLLYGIGVNRPIADVGSVIEDSPAAKAGIIAGDVITSADGKPVKYLDELVSIVDSTEEGSPVNVTIERGGRPMNIVIPETMTLGGKFMGQRIIGIRPSGKAAIFKAGFPGAFVYAGRTVYNFTVGTYRGIWLMITKKMPVKGNMGGPIKIIDILAKAVKEGIRAVLSITGIISLALAIFNMLPFPVLDGGHILFLGIEKLMRRPVNEKTQEVISQVAVVLLIMFVLYVSYFDTLSVVHNIKK